MTDVEMINSPPNSLLKFRDCKAQYFKVLWKEFNAILEIDYVPLHLLRSDNWMLFNWVQNLCKLLSTNLHQFIFLDSGHCIVAIILSIQEIQYTVVYCFQSQGYILFKIPAKWYLGHSLTNCNPTLPTKSKITVWLLGVVWGSSGSDREQFHQKKFYP